MANIKETCSCGATIETPESRTAHLHTWRRIHSVCLERNIVPREVWKNDCDALITALMYGNPPGGWSDPERIKQFQDEIIDIERRLRES